LKTADFAFDLPAEQIAQEPVEPRDSARLLILSGSRTTDGIEGTEHRRFSDLPDLFAPGDLLVVNRSRVLPARLLGTTEGGGRAEALFLGPSPDRKGSFRAIVRPGRRLRVGARFRISDAIWAHIEAVGSDGVRTLRLAGATTASSVLERLGHVPLPPYITRADRPLDRERYQTVYAREPGSIAAPTAGLHFTSELLERLGRRGVRIAEVVLHVGLGTFASVDAENIADHVVSPESFFVPEETARAFRETRNAGRRVVAVGTTTTRALETAVQSSGEILAGSGETRLVIRPGYRFQAIDGLITNFHLPRSSLLFLVAAFGGYDRVMSAYRTAVEAGYRFYSYGDAMFVSPAPEPAG
jgi:S-adenosylmethionine:tRNA ribosyltransferase-isomerase